MDRFNEWFWRHRQLRRSLVRFGLMVAAWNVLITFNYLALHGHLD